MLGAIAGIVILNPLLCAGITFCISWCALI
jgi:hypothetical protein